MHATATVALGLRSAPLDYRAMETRIENKEVPTAAELRKEADYKRAVRDILELLPADVVQELNSGQIDHADPAFLDGLADHVSRQSLADPRNGQRLLGKFIKLKKQITRSLRDSDPSIVVSSTVANSEPRIGRNETCPCGSGRKYKQCCMRKQ